MRFWRVQWSSMCEILWSFEVWFSKEVSLQSLAAEMELVLHTFCIKLHHVSHCSGSGYKIFGRMMAHSGVVRKNVLWESKQWFSTRKNSSFWLKWPPTENTILHYLFTFASSHFLSCSSCHWTFYILLADAMQTLRYILLLLLLLHEAVWREASNFPYVRYFGMRLVITYGNSGVAWSPETSFNFLAISAALISAITPSEGAVAQQRPFLVCLFSRGFVRRHQLLPAQEL